MALKKNSRYSAYITKERICQKSRKKVDFNLIFSVKVFDIKDEIVIFESPNPIMVLDLLKKHPTFFLIEEVNNKKEIYILKTQNLENSFINAKIEAKESLEDRRDFERFSLCEEDLGEFEIFINGELFCKKAYIEDISVVGVKIVVPKIVDEKKIDQIVAKRGHNHLKILIEIESVDIEIGDSYTRIRGKIVDSNISIAKLLTQTYIKIVKKLFQL